MTDETTTTTVTGRGFPAVEAEEVRHYAGAQGQTLGRVMYGLWLFRRYVLLDGMAPDEAAERAGVPRGRAL